MASVLHNPKSITRKSRLSYLITQVVFYSSPFLILTWSYPYPKSIFEKSFPLANLLKQSIANVKGCGVLMVFSFNAWYSKHILNSGMSFFFWKRTCAPYRDVEGLMNPTSRNFVNFLWTSSNSILWIQNKSLARGWNLGSILMQWSVVFLRKISLSKESRNLSTNSSNKLTSFGEACIPTQPSSISPMNTTKNLWLWVPSSLLHAYYKH